MVQVDYLVRMIGFIDDWVEKFGEFLVEIMLSIIIKAYNTHRYHYFFHQFSN